MTDTATHITGVRAISIPVDDQDAALRWYTNTLGFSIVRDSPTPNGGRWIELAPGAANPVVTLEKAAADVTRGAIGIRFATDDAEASHAALQPQASTPTKYSTGRAYPPCSLSVTSTATRSPSPRSRNPRPEMGVRSLVWLHES